MYEQMTAVRDFHKKFDQTVSKPIDEHQVNDVSKDRIMTGRLRGICNVLHQIGGSLKEEAIAHQDGGDDRLYRVWLNVEELAEQITAMIERNEILLADALADRLYILVGDAVTFGIPLQECFETVHESNMTKVRTTNSLDGKRMRSKDHPGYKHPDIVGALSRGRADIETL